MKFPGDRTTRPRKTHKVICDACGVSCEVTFKPKGIRPVLCNNCFKKTKN
ncbi:DNA-directed RNA polymerase [Candidatus Woesearchaeota archaeon]|nr:DNA-directed RNA polymerase [Candidatus Woesearchaeota archaeon]